MKKILFLLLTFSIGNLISQTTVTSLQQLQPYLNDNNVQVKLAPGIYNITANDVASGKFGNPLLPFEGNNSIYDFTGVTINIDTEVLSSFGNVDVNLLQILGNNNILKNLTLVNIGNNAPRKRAQTIVMDGADNLLEGFHMTIRGSYPYGYGDAFGKGGGPVISHRKHSALLVRGESNHVKNCTLIHRSYGHAIFMQAASNPIIEGCYIEGEMRSTDDMLAEEGTGSPADNVDFMTVWGYRLPAGYMLSLGEGGIRAYNAGTTTIDGVEYNRGTSNPTILNCTIKNMRTGVTISHATGTKYVEGCTAIGCENGFSLGSGDVIDCYADCSYGPVYSTTYENDRNYHADITILPSSVPYYNGSGSIAYIGGSQHKITLRGSEEAVEAGLSIKVGGDKNNIRLLNGNLPHQNDFEGKDFELTNLSNFPVVLSNKSSSINVTSCGPVTDNGSNNTISQSDNCVSVVNFVPDPKKKYYLDVLKHNVRLAATGESEAPYTTSTNTTGADVEWQFVAKGNGYWHLQRAAGGTKPRLRTDNSSAADMQPTAWNGVYTYYEITEGTSNESYFLTLPDGPSNYRRLQIDPNGNVNMVSAAAAGSWESFTITPVETNRIVHIRKRNATSFAIDGGNDGKDGQDVYLWTADEKNINQQWIEIDRGNGYYSYQKLGTNYCIDGNHGGATNQNVYLWSCSDTNQNQQWKKVSMGNGAYKLIKRNASGYTIDGGSGGANGQSIELW
ncbi:RICIN domain-containing protein, partial [Aquimarina litoralis]|uniref:RICIN domain-containing protein n=1 Tax=Aquimarina litoralis TaxID=584605 RepID=UPI001C5893EC